MSKTFFSILLVWSLIGFSVNADTIKFSASTGIWSSPLDSAPVGMLLTDKLLDVKKKHIAIFKESLLCRTVDFYLVDLDGKSFWLSPDLGWQNGRAAILHNHPDYSLWAMIFFGVVGGGLMMIYLWQSGLKLPSFFHRYPWLVPVSALIFFHWAWLNYLFYQYPGMFQYPTDEGDYFKIAQALLHWNFQEPFRYTLGYPLFCLPFILLTGSCDPLVLTQAISRFSAEIMMPINMLLAFLLIKKITGSCGKAFWAILLWMILSKLFIAVEYPYQGSLFSPGGRYHAAYIFLAYQFCLCGFNSLSEWCSVGLVLGIMVMTLYLPPSWWKYALLAALFGLACLVRLNNIFLMPAAAYLCWITDKEKHENLSWTLPAITVSVMFFCMVFVWQLVVNHLQFGSFLTFPYILHSKDIHAGFQWRNVFNGSGYYFSILAVPLSITLPALLVIRENKIRNTLILWTMPMVLFFCGFCVLGQHYRFFMPLFYGFTAAIAAMEFWARLTWRQRGLLIIFLITMIVPVLPFPLSIYPHDYVELFSRGWDNLPNVLHRLRLIAFLPVLGYNLYVFRGDRQVMWFLVIFTVLVLLWSPLIYLATAGGLLLYVAISCGRELISERYSHQFTNMDNEMS